MGAIQQATHALQVKPAQNTSVQFVDDAGNAIVITQQDVMTYICDKATAQEVVFFMELCRAQRLNPFLREAFLVKYGTGPASMITAEIVFERRANAHPDYRGMECGVVFIDKDGNIGKREGTATYKALNEQLIGGWARVHRDGRADSYAEVSLEEYDKKQSVWKTMPGVMIQKCAKGVALRLAFPSDFQGMYLEEEMGSAPSIREVHDATVEEAEDDGPDPEMLELRKMTDDLVAYAYEGKEDEVARYLYAKYQEGGIESARAEYAQMMGANDKAQE